MANTLNIELNTLEDLVDTADEISAERKPLRELPTNHLFYFEDGMPAYFLGLTSDNRFRAKSAPTVAVFSTKPPAVKTDFTTDQIRNAKYCVIKEGNDFVLANVFRDAVYVILQPTQYRQQCRQLITSY